ncbi:hypothetical protein VaNZ11_012552, partial [Volvox africanus]
MPVAGPAHQEDVRIEARCRSGRYGNQEHTFKHQPSSFQTLQVASRRATLTAGMLPSPRLLLPTPHLIRPAPAWQMASEPSTTSLSITHVATGNVEDTLDTTEARDRRTSPAATDSTRTLTPGVRATPTSHPGMEMSRSRIRVMVPTVAATAEPPPGQAARRVLRVANLAATRMDSFSSEELPETEGAGQGWNTAKVQVAAAQPSMPAGARAAAPAVSPVRALVPTSPGQAVQSSVPWTALSPVERAQRASATGISDSLSTWSQDRTLNGRWDLRAQQQLQQQHEQALPSPGTGGGWVAINDTVVQQGGDGDGEGTGGNGRSADEHCLGSHNDRAVEHLKVAGTGGYDAIDVGHSGPLPVVGDERSKVRVEDGEGGSEKDEMHYHARSDVASHRGMYICAGDDSHFCVSAGDNGASGVRETGAGTGISNTNTGCTSSGSKGESGIPVFISGGSRCHDAVGEGVGAVVGCNIAGGNSGPAGGYSSVHSRTGALGSICCNASIRIKDQIPSEILNRDGGSEHAAAAPATAWRMPRGTWPLVAAHQGDLSRLAWLRHPSAGGANPACSITTRPSAPSTFPGPPTDFRRFTDPNPWRDQMAPELLQITPPPLLPQQQRQDYRPTRHPLLSDSPTLPRAQQPKTPAERFAHGADNTDIGVVMSDGRENRLDTSAEAVLGAQRVRLQQLQTPFLAVQEQGPMNMVGGSACVAAAAPANNAAVGQVVGNSGATQDIAGMATVASAAMLPTAPAPRPASHPGAGWSVISGDGAGGWPPWHTGSVPPQPPDVPFSWSQAPEAFTGGCMMGPMHPHEMLPPSLFSRLPSNSSQPPAAPQRAALPGDGKDPVDPFLWGFLHNYSREASSSVPPCNLTSREAIPPGSAAPHAGVPLRQQPLREACGKPGGWGIDSASGSLHHRIARPPPAAPRITADGGVGVQTDPYLGMWEGKMLGQTYSRVVAAVAPRDDQRRLGSEYQGDGGDGAGESYWTPPHVSQRTSGCTAVADAAAMPPLAPPIPPAALPLPPVPRQWPAASMEYQLEGVRPGPPSASLLLDETLDGVRPKGIAAILEQVMRSSEGNRHGDGVDSNSGIAAAVLRGAPRDSWALPISHLQAELSWASSSGKPGEVGSAGQELRVLGAGFPTADYQHSRFTESAQQEQPGQYHNHAQYPREQRPGAWLGTEAAQLQVAVPQVQVNVNLDAGSLRDVFQQCLQATVPAVCAAAAAAAVLGQGAVQAGGTDDRVPYRGGTGAAQRFEPGQNPLGSVLGLGQYLGRSVATQTQSPPRDQAVQTERVLPEPPEPPQPPSSPSFLSLPAQESSATAAITPGARQLPSTWQGFSTGEPVVDNTRGGFNTALMRSFSPAHSEMLRRTAMVTPAVAPLAIPAALDMGRGASRAPMSLWSSPDRAFGEAVTAEEGTRLDARFGAGKDHEGGGNASTIALSSLRGSLSLARPLTPALCRLPMPAETRGPTLTSGVPASNAEGRYGVDAVGQPVAAQVSTDNSRPVFHSRAAANLFEECRREIHKRAAVEPPRFPARAPTTSTSGIRPPAAVLASRANVGSLGSCLPTADSLSYPIGLPETKRRKLSPLRPKAGYGVASHGVTDGEGTAALGAPGATSLAGVSFDPGLFVRSSPIVALSRADVADGLGLNPALLRYAPPSLASLELASLERLRGAHSSAVLHAEIKGPQHDVWLQEAKAEMAQYAPDFPKWANGMVLGKSGVSSRVRVNIGFAGFGDVTSPGEFPVGRCPTELEEMACRSRLADGMAAEQRKDDAGTDTGETGEQVASPTHIQTRQSEML